MADLQRILRRAINPALRILPAEMTSEETRQCLLAIGLQESEFETREQYGGGPARGYWQFELGTEASHGGVWGVYLHPASQGPLQYLCQRRSVEFDPEAIYETLAHDDILAAGVARLLMWTDPYAVPTSEQPAWTMYAERTWRPGKPRPDDWPGNWSQASQAMDWAVTNHSPDVLRPTRCPTCGRLL